MSGETKRIQFDRQADVAQVVAHLIGNEEVTGPSPVISFLMRLSEKSGSLFCEWAFRERKD